MVVDEAADAVAGDTFYRGGEVLRRHVQSLGIVAHLALRATDARGEQIHQLFDDIGGAVAVGVGGLAPCVKLEDVVHHREAEASHQLAVERQVAVVHAVAQTVEVGQDDGGLLVGEVDDGVVVERDAAPDAIVVRWQEALQELVVGGEPLHPQVWMCGQVLHAGGRRYHHEVVFHDMVAPVVEHEAALARRTEHVHAGVTQLRGVYREKIRRVLEVNFHGAKIRKLSIETENFCANCENNEGFCESDVWKK